MNKYFASLVTPCLLFAGLGIGSLGTAAAQDNSAGTTPPPKILEIIVETLKPGAAGTPHYKTESAFPRAFAAAHWPQHYFAMDALAGKPRTVFFIGYGSFAAMQKDMEATEKDATLSAALDEAKAADSALLEAYETSTYALRDDLSLRGPVKIEAMRYFEISIVNIRPGHRHDFDTLAKMYMSAYEKVPGAHWATFEKMYGTQSGSRYIIVTPMQSLAEVDQEIADQKQFASTLGGDEMKKLADLTASSVESSESNIFAINPKLSYPSDEWVKAAPDFWGQK